MKKFNTKKLYISTDVEASGKTPMSASLLSIGAAVVGATDINFYVELKPRLSRDHYDINAMRIGCLGLDCLQGNTDPTLDPQHALFDPRKVLDLLMVKGIDIQEAMRKYADWIMKVKKTFRKKPIEIAGPIKFDGMWSDCYFDFAHIPNPFGHSAEDLNSLYRGLEKDLTTHTKGGIYLNEKNPLKHNALQDAIHQGKLIEVALTRHGLIW